ncbi:MAG TPA: hypothetical protein DDY41_17665 [Arthrobacter bacterium]|jgi:hypothetical protein|nr:hypothetical protein [Arthrobacter sp.]
MRLHTNTLTWRAVHEALDRAILAGRIPAHVSLITCAEYRSRVRKAGIEIQLGTYDKEPGDGRRWSNTGTHGANSEANGEGVYAATWNEWGWFLAEVFAADPEAKCNWYDGAAAFHARTKNAFTGQANAA